MKVAGIHSVRELLHRDKPVEKVFVKQNSDHEALRNLIAQFRSRNVPVKYVPQRKLDKLFRGNHQGIVAIVPPVRFMALEDLVQRAFQSVEKPVFVLLDGITDTRNLGAIIRSAVAFEADGIIIPEHHSAPVNEEVAKTSSGGIFHIPLTKVKHLSDAVFYLQSSGVEIIAATEKAATGLDGYKFTAPVGIIMGDEHKGVSHQLLKISNKRLKINISGKMDSLNVSVAAGIFLYEIHKQLKLEK